MLTKVYGAIWMITLSAALILFLTGSMTMMGLIVIGFIAFGLTFMGMMGVLPALVVHAHHDIANATPIADAAQNIRGRLRDYKETLATETLAVRKPKYP